MRHLHAYHADATITTSSGYVGHGVEVSVDHEQILLLNHVLAHPNGNRIRAKIVLVWDAGFTVLRVERFRLECIGRKRVTCQRRAPASTRIAAISS